MSFLLQSLLRLGAQITSAFCRHSHTQRGVGPLLRALRRLGRVGFVPQVVKRHGRRWLITDLRNNAQEAVFFGLPYDPQVTEMLRAVLKPGDIAIDVGANVGFFTSEMASLVGTTGRVLAFEPAIEHSRVLCANLALQNLTQVEVWPVALGARRERVIHYTTASSGSVVSSFPELGVPLATARTISLEALDSIVDASTARHLRCIKIDVDGNEQEVVLGAKKLLTAARPCIIIEVSERTQQAAGSTAAALLAVVEKLGYRFSAGPCAPRLCAEELLAAADLRSQMDILCVPACEE